MKKLILGALISACSLGAMADDKDQFFGTPFSGKDYSFNGVSLVLLPTGGVPYPTSHQDPTFKIADIPTTYQANSKNSWKYDNMVFCQPPPLLAGETFDCDGSVGGRGENEDHKSEIMINGKVIAGPIPQAIMIVKYGYTVQCDDESDKSCHDGEKIEFLSEKYPKFLKDILFQNYLFSKPGSPSGSDMFNSAKSITTRHANVDQAFGNPGDDVKIKNDYAITIFNNTNWIQEYYNSGELFLGGVKVASIQGYGCIGPGGLFPWYRQNDKIINFPKKGVFNTRAVAQTSESEYAVATDYDTVTIYDR